MNRQRIALALAGVGVLVATIGLGQTGPTLASWPDSNYHSATITSGLLNPVTSLTCNGSAGLLGASIGFTWTQPVTTGNGLVPTTYTMTWAGPGGSSTTVPGLTASIPGNTLAIGTYTVTVVAKLAGWTSAVSTVSRSVLMVAIVGWTCS